MANTNIDQNDLKILEILKKNARTPYTTIAKELKVSEAAVRKRIEKLIQTRNNKEVYYRI